MLLLVVELFLVVEVRSLQVVLSDQRGVSVVNSLLSEMGKLTGAPTVFWLALVRTRIDAHGRRFSLLEQLRNVCALWVTRSPQTHYDGQFCTC